jgi:uncharacterized protein
MSDITPLIRSDAQVIQSYRGGGFRISHQNYIGPVFVTSAQTRPWPATRTAMIPHSTSDLNPDFFGDFLPLLGGLEVILIGTGGRQILLSPTSKAWFKSHDLGVETMDTGAACRAYQVMMAEGRLVGAMLVPLA